jgi:hypothetical protein
MTRHRKQKRQWVLLQNQLQRPRLLPQQLRQK